MRLERKPTGREETGQSRHGGSKRKPSGCFLIGSQHKPNLNFSISPIIIITFFPAIIVINLHWKFLPELHFSSFSVLKYETILYYFAINVYYHTHTLPTTSTSIVVGSIQIRPLTPRPKIYHASWHTLTTCVLLPLDALRARVISKSLPLWWQKAPKITAFCCDDDDLLWSISGRLSSPGENNNPHTISRSLSCYCLRLWCLVDRVTRVFLTLTSCQT